MFGNKNAAHNRHQHPLTWDDTAETDRASRHKELLVKEALHIRTPTRNDSLNGDGGVELHDCWVATLRRSERLWQHCQCSENKTPSSSDVL